MVRLPDFLHCDSQQLNKPNVKTLFSARVLNAMQKHSHVRKAPAYSSSSMVYKGAKSESAKAHLEGQNCFKSLGFLSLPNQCCIIYFSSQKKS